MGTLYHFGDSYGGVGDHDKHFVKHISERINYDFSNQVQSGSANEEILTRLLSCIMDIKEGDMLFFNFSFFIRGCYYNRKMNRIMATNSIYNDSYSYYEINRPIETKDDYIIDIINYQLDNNEDYNRRLFFQFDAIFKQLRHRNIPIYYIFIVENEWSNTLLNYGTKITFPLHFSKWLDDNGYHNQEECHYTRGIQENICDYVMKQLILK